MSYALLEGGPPGTVLLLEDGDFLLLETAGVFAAWPTLLVEIDVTNQPTNPARVWTDITEYVRAGTWTRDGRIAETERTTTGSCSLTLDNRPDPVTGEPFDKDNAASPLNANGGLAWSYYIRISLAWGGTTYVVWTGIKDDVPKARPSFGKDRTATLNGVTTSKLLDLFLIPDHTFVRATADARVTDVLTQASIPAGTIDSTTVSTDSFPDMTVTAKPRNSPFGTSNLYRVSGLYLLQQVELDERGLIFAQADGDIGFQGRHYRAQKVLDGATATIGESDGDIRYVEAAPDDNNSYLWNRVSVTTQDVDNTLSESLDDDSIALNFQRRLDILSLYDDPTLGLYESQWYVNRFAQPPQRLPQIELLGAHDPSTWPAILAAANSDLFTWEGGDSTLSVFLERVSMAFDPKDQSGRIRVYWDTSPSIRDTVWKLGVHGASELKDTTRLG